MRKQNLIWGKIVNAGLISIAAVTMFAGCGKDENTKSGTAAANTNGISADSASAEGTEAGEVMTDHDSSFPFGEAFCDGRFYTEELAEPDTKVTAESIYSSMTYTEQMFYGDYRLNHVNDSLSKAYATQEFINTIGWWDASNVSGNLDPSLKISDIPYRMVAGTAELDNALTTDTSHSWCQLYFATKDDNTGVCIDAAYEVEGTKITFTPVAEWNFDDSLSQLSYTLEDKSFCYSFEFSGPRLTFSNDTESYTLIERVFTKWNSIDLDNSVTMESSLSQNSKTVDKITGIDFTVYLDSNDKLVENKSSFQLKSLDSDGNEVNCSGIARWDEDGLFTFSYQDKDGETHSHSMVIFYCGYDGMILSDGKNNYYYLSTYLASMTEGHFTPEQLEEIVSDLGGNLSEEDQQKLETMTEEEIEEVIETRTSLLDDLSTAFTENGIAAEVDEETGEIVLDSSILFASGESELSDEGKAALESFIRAFGGVIGDDKYDGFIAEVEVQGHTDTNGEYDMNLELSQKRAESVKDYCLESAASIDENTVAKLENLFVPVGYSYDYPVYNEDGTVNMDASRRVEFVFFINLNKEQD